ncbi:CotH kinase family protein [Microbacterium sp.]|uniref:CotH kinase family protein n=1 Tax=Microbacterium sp. TaxID=51671 RepID=UPI003A89C17F
MDLSRLRPTALLVASAVVIGAVGCAPAAANAPAAAATPAATADVWDSTRVHSFAVNYDADDYDAMIATYVATEQKEWIAATVTVDGVTYENAGLKLKGNSSLRGLSTDADAQISAAAPESLPWIIRLDKFVDGQTHGGAAEFAVRANSTQTALNEAVALDLLAAAGLASQEAIAARFSAGGSDDVLRLIVENPTDTWMTRELGVGSLYKAEAGGDYSYRGDDPDAYTDIFDQEGGTDDLVPLIDFLRWINDASDAEFAADLDDHLEVEAFATYLAFQDLIGNQDDIDGPGNNSYLFADSGSDRMTVVSWDLNLAFGQANVGGGPGDASRGPGAHVAADGAPPERPDGAQGPGGGPGGTSNVLSARFLADDDFAQLVQQQRERLQIDLFDSGLAAGILTERTAAVEAGASDLVAPATIASEAETLSAAFPS